MDSYVRADIENIRFDRNARALKTGLFTLCAISFRSKKPIVISLYTFLIGYNALNCYIENQKLNCLEKHHQKVKKIGK